MTTAWRFVESGAHDAALNMAIDEMLMDAVRAGGPPTLRLYGWSPPAVSLGRNQPAKGAYDREGLDAAGVDLVRRLTGGRAVLHDAELTYSVSAPARWFGSARGAYRRINEVLVSAVGRLGARALVHSAGGAGAHALDNTPCFAEPAEGEVVALGRKLIGSAQMCEGGVLLQHGSLPLRPSIAMGRLSAEAARMLDGRPAYLADVVDAQVGWGDVANAVAAAWEAVVAPLDPRPLAPGEIRSAQQLASRYRSDDWTWRR